MRARSSRVRVRHIPLQIRSTFRPDLPGTLIRTRHDGASGIAGFAGRRRMAMLRIHGAPPAHRRKLCGHWVRSRSACRRRSGKRPCCWTWGSGLRNGHAGRASARAAAGGGGHAAGESCGARGDLPHIGRHPARAASSRICRCAIHHLLRCAPGLLMIVNDSQYETALRSASVSK